MAKRDISGDGRSQRTATQDTDHFLSALRRLYPPPPANSHAKASRSDTLPEAGYARSDNENEPIVLLLRFAVNCSLSPEW